MPKLSKLLVALSLLPCLAGCPSASSLMRSLGYTPLKPPSLLLQPGALVYVKSSSSGEFSAGLLCGPRASLGSHWKPMRSPTASQSISKAKGQSFAMDASLMEEIRADVRFSNITKITMSLTNATIVEISDIDVIDNVRYRSEGCKAAIKHRLQHGYKVTMVHSALMGNVIYSVSWDSSFSANVRAKVRTLEQLALELGGGATSVTDSVIKSEGLAWGISDSPFLASLSIPEMSNNRYDPSQRLIGNHLDATIPPVPDTPVVRADHEEQADDLPIKVPNLPPIPSTLFKQERVQGPSETDDR